MSIPTHVPPLRIFARSEIRTDWLYIFPPGTLREHVLDPRIWRHVGRKLQRFDTIDAVAEDGSFDIQLRVLAADPQGMWAQTAILTERQPSETLKVAVNYPDKDGFTVEFSGPQLWRIRRGEDLIDEGFPDQAAAVAALARLKGSKPIEAVTEPEPEPADPDGWAVKFAGPHKWRILRHGDVVETMLPTKDAAEARLAEIKAA